MKIITNPDQIRQIVEAKQRNEQKLLHKLNELFKNPAATNHVRGVVCAAFAQMWAEAQTGSPAVRGALLAEENLAVWSTLVPPTTIPHFRVQRMLEKLRQGAQAQPPLDANDLSELIRVIGAWMEKGGGYGVADINKAFRVGVEKIQRSAEHAARGGKGEALEQQKALDDKLWGRDVRQREDPSTQPDRSFHHPIEPHVANWWVPPKQHNESGMQMFRVNGNDLCKRIDLLFGLLPGATVSGTTTDTALVLESYGAAQNLHAGYYLFPVATIAASLHHTLLEAAIALTVVGAIESYCVGFYTTLIPKGGFPAELADVWDVLAAAENDAENRHFILWYDGNENSPAGCILWDKPFEVREARRLAEAKGLVSHVMSLPAVPGKKDVARFINLMAPRLLAYLPGEFQPAPLRIH